MLGSTTVPPQIQLQLSATIAAGLPSQSPIAAGLPLQSLQGMPASPSDIIAACDCAPDGIVMPACSGRTTNATAKSKPMIRRKAPYLMATYLAPKQFLFHPVRVRLFAARSPKRHQPTAPECPGQQPHWQPRHLVCLADPKLPARALPL